MSCEDNVPEVVVATKYGDLTILSVYWADGVLCIDVCLPGETED